MVLEKSWWAVRHLAKIWLLLSCTLSWPALAVIEDAKQILKTLKTLEADYTQQLLGEGDELLQRTEGHLSLSVKPLGLRIQEKEPMRLQVVFDGNILWQYDEELSQAIQYSKHDMLDAPLLALFENPDWDNWQQKTSQSCVDSALRCYDLTPPKQAKTFAGLSIGVNRSSKIIELHLLLPTGEKNSYQLREVKQNQSLPPTIFHFSVPKGVDLMKG